MKYQNGTSPILDNLGRPQKVIIINESGLYSLILSSKLPTAKKFKRWVTSEVLPAIRKTGKYETPEQETTEQRQLTVDDYIRAAGIIAGCRNERIPTVLALLKKGGLDIPMLEDVRSKYDETGETAMLINRAINEFGINQAQIAKMCGLHPTQIMRIRTGEAKPKKERAAVIRSTLQDAIAEMQ